MRFDIVGLTLAELALVLLFALMAVIMPAKERKARDANKLFAENAVLHEQATALAAKVKALERGSKAHQEETVLNKPPVTAGKSDLRSKAMPSCAENDPTTGWLFTATIRAADRYEIDKENFDLQGILRNFAPAIQRAQGAQCFERIKVLIGRNISAAEYDLALRRLEEHFYTKKLGEEP